MNDLLISKAKRLDTGEWVEGYIIECDRSDSGYCIWRKIENEYHMTDINIESICRCTGLHDSMGKLIFEYDLVHIADWSVSSKVYWNCGCWMLYFEDSDEYLNENCHVCEIIGNALEG